MFKRTSSSSSTTNNNITTTTDQRVAADNGAIVNRNGTVNVTDGGAIKLAGEMAEQAIDAGVLFAGMGVDLAETSMGSTIETLEAIIDAERDDAAQLSEQLINMIPWLVAGVVAWSIFK